MKTIVLDAGHGGEDYGAVNGSRYEKNDNLRLALAVGDILKKYGQNVVYTRTGDVYVPLLDRSIIANNANADIFVSLHRNSSANPAANGVQNFVQTGSAAVNTLYARTVLDKILGVGGFNSRGVSQENFSVLRNTKAPAQLLELGFISNDNDNKLFDQNFNAYANAIAMGILTALGESTTLPSNPPSGGADTTVSYIQDTLNSRYGTGLAVDGKTGPKTRAALTKGLQTTLNREYGANLTADGVFGARTKAACPLVRSGARGNLVWLIQAALYLKGYSTNGIDGVFGPATLAAVQKFQKANNLSADGIAGPATFEKLFG